MSLIKIENLSLTVDKLEILKDISFSLEKQEVISIVGPSGSGKSSILRLIAGLIKPSSGKIYFSNKIISSENFMVPTGQRQIALMFQEDVLFPHLTVFKNIAFGIDHKPLNEKEGLVINYLKKFGLLEKKENYPSSLSGGEKQRASLARVLITKPKVLLMDEPFSNLDTNLRKDICNYTLNTLKKNKIPVVFVTHDIEEAMSVSDKVIVIKKGKVLQIDTPKKIYSFPKTKFVAEMLGSINQFAVIPDSKGQLITPFGKINCSKCIKSGYQCNGKQHFCVIRPENLMISKKGIKAKVINKYFLGASWSYLLHLGPNKPKLNIANCKKELKRNEQIRINLNKKSILIFQE